MAARIKVHELRGKNKAELQTQLKEFKSELSLLRVAKVTGGAPNKLSKMCVLDCSVNPPPSSLFRFPRARGELKPRLGSVASFLLQQGGAHLHRARAHRDLAEAEGGAAGGVQEKEAAPARPPPQEDPRHPQAPHQAPGIHAVPTSTSRIFYAYFFAPLLKLRSG